MSREFVCDCPKCREIMEEPSTESYQHHTDDCLITIVLPEGDYCVSCARKLRARAARSAGDELKTKRKVKTEARGDKGEELPDG